MSASKIKVQPGVEIEPEYLARYEAYFYHPGEKVKLDQSAKYAGELTEAYAALAEQFDRQELLIKETVMSPADNGVAINYIFEGIDGLYSAQFFTNPEGYEHRYGVLIMRDNQTWLVPLTDDYKNPTAGEPCLINAEISRAGRYDLGINNQNQAVEDYLNHLQDESESGEFYLIPKGDNHWVITASPWRSSASANEIETAEQAIAAYLANHPTDNQDQADEQQLILN